MHEISLDESKLAIMRVVCNAKGAVTSLDVGKEIEDKGWKMIC